MNRLAQIELVAEGFTGTGLDGYVRARLWVDRQPGQLVTFSISEFDKKRLEAESDIDVDHVWSTAMTEMTSRLPR